MSEEIIQQQELQVEVGAGEVTIRLMGEAAFDSGRADIRVILKIIFRLHEARAGDKFLSTS
jgi:hypothetical protein